MVLMALQAGRYATSVYISHNTISSNSQKGVFIDGDQVGLNDTNNAITSNTITNNGFDGIYIGGQGTKSSVISNTISNNGGKKTGITIEPSYGSFTPTISFNNILSNTGKAFVVNYYSGSGLPHY